MDKWLSQVLLALCCVQGVSAGDYTGMLAAGCVSGFFLVMLVAFLIIAVNWDKWFGERMRAEGKSKAPKSYLKKKKAEAKMRLAQQSNGYIKSNRSSSKSKLNGTMPMQSDIGLWVQHMGQPKDTIYDNPYYEEKEQGITMDPENEEVFQIETELVDNEVLDVGPYKSMAQSDAKPTHGDIYPEPYIYTPTIKATNSSAQDTVMHSSPATGGWVSSQSNGRPASKVMEVDGKAMEGAEVPESPVTNIDDILIRI